MQKFEYLPIPTKGDFVFNIEGTKVLFSGNFDSGNCSNVKLISGRQPYVHVNIIQFRVEMAFDSDKVQVTTKTFFHFMVQGYPTNKPIRIMIMDVKLLTYLQRASRLHHYRPYIKMGTKADYKRLPLHNVIIHKIEDRIDVEVRIAPTQQIFYVSFALPYSYSLQLRLSHLITISSFDEMRDSSQVIGGESNGVIFPQRHLSEPQKEFSKPVVIISARVHPGESQSSHAIEGIIKFLMSEDVRAYILRRHFQFLIVPMLNPDGVYYGFYRMDTNAINLNRYYVVCDSRQPTVYSLRHLINHYTRVKRLLYFFDLHGHPRHKGSFIYGNAMDDVVNQTETCMFAKLMSLNSQTFDENECIFRYQQQAKQDRLDELTKEGCARVYTYRYSGIIHSYTFEFGFHSTASVNKLQPESNAQYVHQSAQGGNYSLLWRESIIESAQQFEYQQQDYHNEGVAILISILDSLEINPYSRIPNTEFRNNFEIRKQMSKNMLALERFRMMERNTNQKINNINELINEIFFKQITERGFFKDFSKKWPSCVNFARYNTSPHKRKYQKVVNNKRSIDVGVRVYEETTEYETVQAYSTSVSPSIVAYNVECSLSDRNELQIFTIEHKQVKLVNEFVDSKLPEKTLPSREQKLLEELKAYEEAMEAYRHSESSSPTKHKVKLRMKYNISTTRQQDRRKVDSNAPSAMMDLINFDDSKLQMHRFTAVSISPTKQQDKLNNVDNQSDISQEVLVHHDKFDRLDYSEYKGVFGNSKQSFDSSQIKLVHIGNDQPRRDNRLISKPQLSQPQSSKSFARSRRHFSSSKQPNEREITHTQLPQLDSVRRFTMYQKIKMKGSKQ